MSDVSGFDESIQQRGIDLQQQEALASQPQELTGAQKLQQLGQALKFFGSAFNQFAGGPNTDPGVLQHQKAVQDTQKASASIRGITEGATKLTKFMEFIAPDKQEEALMFAVESATTQEDITIVNMVNTARKNPRAVADAQAGASVVAKVAEVGAILQAIQNPEVLEELGLTREQVANLQELGNIEGDIVQIARIGNQIPENLPDGSPSPVHITDNELVQLTSNPAVRDQANQLLGAQPAEAFVAGERAAAVQATRPADIPKSQLLDQRGEVTPTALNRVQQSLGQILGGQGVSFGPQGEMRIVDPQVGLQLGRMAGRAAELIKGGKGLQESVNAAAEAEGFDVSGARGAAQQVASETVQANVQQITAKLENATNEQIAATLQRLRENNMEEEAKIVEEQLGGMVQQTGRAIRGVFQ